MMAAPAIYSTMNETGIDVNLVFYLDPKEPSYPAPPFNPGTMCFGSDGSAWVYVTTSVSLATGSVCRVSEVPGSFTVAPVGGGTIAAASAPVGDLLGVVSGSNGSL